MEQGRGTRYGLDEEGKRGKVAEAPLMFSANMMSQAAAAPFVASNNTGIHKQCCGTCVATFWLTSL